MFGGGRYLGGEEEEETLSHGVIGDFRVSLSWSEKLPVLVALAKFTLVSINDCFSGERESRGSPSPSPSAPRFSSTSSRNLETKE